MKKIIDNIIKKRIDNYFFNILKEKIEYLFFRYMMEVKFEKTKGNVILYGKNFNYKDECYKQFGIFTIQNSINFLMDFEELEKNLKKSIKKYKEEE